MDRPTASHARPSRRRRLALAAAALAAAAAALLAPRERSAIAASPLTINVPIAIDGSFADWDAVLANPLQTTRDGDGSSAAIRANCSLYSTDRDCPQTGGAGNDFLTFAWTYDATHVYLYVERYGSTSNGVDFLFVADVDRDQRLTLVKDGAPSKDAIVHANWFGGTGNVTIKLWSYDPADDVNGDPLVCTPVAPATRCANAAGLLVAPAGYVDGYKLPGVNVGRRDCPGGAPCSGRGDTSVASGGLKVEIAIPWSAFGTTVQAPFYWHTVSSNNDSIASTVDNIGAPNGGLGSFVQRGVALGPDRAGAVLSPGQVSYAHTLVNEGNDQDDFELVATSSQGAQLEVLDGGVVIATDLTGDGTWDSVRAGRDQDGDGRPDVTLAAGASRALTLRITMPEGRSGEDVSRLTAASAADAAVSATATDTSHVGTVAFVPVAHAASTVAAQGVPFRETLVNGQADADTFELAAVPDPACAGYRLELLADAAGNPGAVFAVDADGGGTFESATPDVDGDLLPELLVAGDASAAFHLRATPPPGAAAGSACAVALVATGSAGATATATHRVTVAPAVSFAPDHRGATAGLADAADTQIPSGGAVFFPATIRNAEAVSRTYALSAVQAGGGLAPRIWSDPDGDGNPSDGAVITQSDSLPAFGGAQHVVVEVRAGAAPTGSFLVTTATATALVGGASASQVSESVVGFLAVFGDALHTDANNVFAPCSTVFVEARGLAPGDVGTYALEWAPPSGVAPPRVSPWPTTARGTADAELALGDAAALGTWTARLLELDALKDDVAFTVALPGAAPAVSTDRARYAAGDAVAVTASVRNDSAAALEGTSLVYSGPTARVRAAVDAAAGATVTDAFTFALPAGAAPGARTLTLGWRLACGAAPFLSASTTFDVVPAPPAVTSPAAGDLVADATPTISGTARPGATVAVTVTGPGGTVASTPVAADATTGAWAWTVPEADALGEGAHAVTAVQTAGGLDSAPSAPVAFTVDTIPPAPPSIGAPSSGTVTNLAAVPVSGAAADPEATQVELLVDGAVVATVPVVAGGFTAPLTLADGTRVLTARALDAAGNASAPSAAVSITVDTVAPAAPTLVAASRTNAQPVPFTGTAEPLATVELLEGGAVVATVQAGADGAFSTTVPLAAGSHVLVARATDAAGNVGPGSASATVLVDRTAPAVPEIVTPAPSAVLGAGDLVSGQVVFSGTAEPFALVELEVDGVSAGGASADAFGDWSLPATVAGGDHTVRARATDLAGNASPLGTAVPFTLDATLPATPVLASPTGPLSTSALDLPVAGTAEPGATVRVYLDGVLVDEVTADASGLFSKDVALPATDGTRQLTVVAVDAGGNASPPTAPIAIAVDRTPPAAPAISAPGAGAFATSPSVVVSGTAEPLSTVRVTADSGQTATVTAAADGTWQATLTAVPDGARTVTARATDAAGNFAEATRGFTVDTAAPAAPAIASPASGTSTSAATVTVAGTAPADAVLVRILDGGAAVGTGAATGGAFSVPLTPAEGGHVYTAVAVDAAGNPSPASAPVSVAVDRTAPLAPALAAPASPTRAAQVTFTGTAEPGATVEIVVGGTVVATGAADATTGAYAIPAVLPEGVHAATARASDAAGNTGPASSAVTVTVDRSAPLAPALAAPASPSNAAQVTFTGTAEPGATVEIVVGGAVVGTGAADPTTGAWAIPVALAEGDATVAAQARDAAGNLGPASAPVSVTVDRTAPPAPVLTPPSTPTNATQVTFAGTAEPGATVEIVVGGAVVGTGTADATTGAYAIPVALPEGEQLAAARATDAAGNAGAASASATVTVDRTAPGAPVIDAPADGAAFPPGEAEVSGHAEPGATVAVTVGGTTETTTAAGDGTWSVVVGVPAGEQTVSATATDAAGNTSAAGEIDVVARTDDGVGGGGCGCRSTGGAPGALALLGLLALAPRRRRAPR